MHLFRLFFLLGVLAGCAPESPKLEVRLRFDPNGEAIRMLGFVQGVEALSPLSTRVIWTHRGQRVQGKPGYKIFPIEAAPPAVLRPPEPFTLETEWNLARGSGVPWDPDRPTLEVSGLPINVEGLSFAIEFLLPVIETVDGENVTNYYVVAYACVDFPLTTLVDLGTLKARLDDPVWVYSGRTCGQCPRLEEGGAEEDDPSFNYSDLNNTPRIIPDRECGL